MKSTRDYITYFSYILSIFILIGGALVKIIHWPGSHLFLVLGILLLVVFIISALSEVYSSKNIKTDEKVMWTVGFIMFGSISGFIYLAMARKRILQS